MTDQEQRQLRAELCFASFQAAGTVCGGCQMQNLCGMNQQSRRFLSELLDKIDPLGQTFRRQAHLLDRLDHSNCSTIVPELDNLQVEIDDRLNIGI